MLQQSRSVLCVVLLSLAFIGGRCQTVQAPDEGECPAGVCPKKGRAMLQTKRNAKRQHMATAAVQNPGTSYTLVFENERCHGRHRTPGGWGNLGSNLNNQQCQDACTALSTCLWVTIRNGQCTSYNACDTTQTGPAGLNHITWKKEEATDEASFSYTLVLEDERCHPRLRTAGVWGDLGTGLNDAQCQEACSALAECAFVTIRRGQCTSYSSCDDTQSNQGSIGHLVWQKHEGSAPTPPPPTVSFSYTLVLEDERCHPRLRTAGVWGDLGTGLNDAQCQAACSALAACAFVTIRRGQCTSYSSCDDTQSNQGSIGHIVWQKHEGSAPTPPPPTRVPPTAPPPTPPPPTSTGTGYTLVFENERCHGRHRTPGGWGNLGSNLNNQQCQDACTALSACLWVTIKDGQCTSYNACDTTQAGQAGQNHITWKKEQEQPIDDACVTRCLSQRSSSVRDLRASQPDPDMQIHINTPDLSAIEVNKTSKQDPGTIFMTRERLCALRCSPTTGATRKRGLGLRPGESRRRRRSPAARRRMNGVYQPPTGGIPQCTDAASLGLDDSWFYTWGSTDSVQRGALTQCAREETRVAREFVPMVLNCQQADVIWNDIDTFKTAWEALGAKFLLGYNEPDGSHQTCSPREGAQQWVTVQKIANAFDPPLRLVSPSPCSGSGDSCPGGGFAFGESPWLTQFFANCSEIPDCNPEDVEMIGFHDYEGDFNIRDDNLQVRIENAAQNYAFANGMKRQIWATEVNAACGRTSLCRTQINAQQQIYRDGATDWPVNAEAGISQEEHLWYMRQIIPYMENSEDVFRYTWFGIRSNESFSGHPNLLPYEDDDDDTPTLLGRYYMEAEGVR